MKIITKINCTRCEEIKNYLNTSNIPFKEENAEEKGYDFWRDLVREKTGKPGFPILINNDEVENGSTEELLEYINKQTPTKEVTYFWGE